MVRIAFSLALSLLAAPLFAEDSYTFHDIPWGSSRADVKATLEANDFDVTVTKDAILFTSMLGESTVEMKGRASFDERGLSSVMIAYTLGGNPVVKLYDLILQSLTNAFGEPTVSVREFQTPYAEGDGFEDTAILAGKARLTAGWGTEDGEHVKIGATGHELDVVIGVRYQAGAQE